MLRSDTHIRTSHAGSLPRPDELIAANQGQLAGQVDEPHFQATLRHAALDFVRWD